MAETTTIRLPPKLRSRLRAIAKETDRSVHSIIIEAVEKHAAYEEQMRNLVKDALAADVEMDRAGEAYRAEKTCTPGRARSRRALRVKAQAVAKVVYSARALENLDRAFTSPPAEGPAAEAAAADAIESAVNNLAAHPLVGRRVEGDIRELVISFGATGYRALSIRRAGRPGARAGITSPA
jgi:plasmid stabilization system protein ParE/predicted transcriptional regulator